MQIYMCKQWKSGFYAYKFEFFQETFRALLKEKWINILGNAYIFKDFVYLYIYSFYFEREG